MSITVALMGHSVVQSVRPDRNAAQGSSDGGIIDKELISHHFKLLVSTNTEERSSDTNNRSVSDVGESLNNETISSHLSQPVIISSFSPVFRVITVGDREDSNLMTATVKLLHSRVVRILVRNIEGSLQATAIGVLPFAIEDLLEEVNVVGVNGTVEGDGDHLRNLSGVNVSGNPGTIRGAETIRELTLAEVTVGGPVGVLVDGTGVFVGAIGTVGPLVAEQLLVNALAVSALKLVVGADGFVGFQVRKNSSWL